MIGNASGLVPPFDIMRLKPKNLKLARPEYVFLQLALPNIYHLHRVGNYMVTAAEVTQYSYKLYEAIASGVLKMHVFGEYPFSAEGVGEAQVAQASGKTIGKLIIKVAD